jgi:hypothetical protein
MAVSTKKQTYTAHGREFDKKEDAERYDALETARQGFDDAREKYDKLLAQSQRTADGQRFELGRYGDYWFIVNVLSFPDLRRVAFYGWNLQAREDKAGVSIREPRGDGGREDHWFPIKELYADESEARKALAAAQAERLGELARQTNELRKSLGLRPVTVKIRADD